MRLLLVVHAFPPRSTAGVEVYTLRLARAFRDLGHTVRILTAVHDLAAQPHALRRRDHDGLDVMEVVNVHHRGSVEATYADPAIDAAVARVLAEFRPELVHVQHLLNLSCGLVREARRAGAHVVLTLHDYWLSCARDGLRLRGDLVLCESPCGGCLDDSPYLVPPLQRGLAGLARRIGLGGYLHRAHDWAPGTTGALLRLLRRTAPQGQPGQAAALERRAATLRTALADVDVFLAPTAFARERALEFGLPAEKVRVLELGAVLGPGVARPARARRRFGYVGTLAPHKGVHVLVEAFRGLVDPGSSLDVYGSLSVQPGYVESLRRLAAADPRIRFHGGFPEGDQARVLAALDALVIPSLWWENSPLTALEALAAGVPIVASRIGGIPELVPERVGLLVPPGDIAALGHALAELAAGRQLEGALPPLALKTVADGASELLALYASLAAV